MAKYRLLQSVCTVALLAAVPALAQTSPQPGTTGATSSPAPSDTMGSGGTMTPADKMGSPSGSHAGMSRHSTMTHAMGSHARTGSTAQNGEVDRLNDQSYQAARNGQAFNGASPMDTATPASTGASAGSTNNPPGTAAAKTGSTSSGGSK